MQRLNLISPLLPLVGALLFVGCELSVDGSEDATPEIEALIPTPDGVWTPISGLTQITSNSGYVLGPETLAVFVGESMSVELELLEPKLFELRAGLMPEEATFTGLPAGALVEWEPGVGDIGTHEIVLLVVDTNEPNLVIAQEMFVVDVLPRLRFIEYGF